MLARLGLQVGQAFSMIVDSVPLEMIVVATVDHFPSFYPEAEDFFIVDQAPLLAVLNHDGSRLASVNEAWLSVSPASDQADLTRLAGRLDVTGTVDRRQAQAAALRDPVLRDLLTNLLLGFLAALVLSGTAAIVHFLVSTRTRLSEYAILQANGLGHRLLVRSLGIEHGLLIAFGVVVGLATGLALAWVLVPALQEGGDLATVVPPTVMSVDVRLVFGAVAVMVLMTGLGSRLASRFGVRFRLMDELRLLG